MKNKSIFRVRFMEKDQKQPVEILVRHVEPSDFPGLVCFSSFVFRDQTKKIIMPEEDAATKRFKKTKSLHVPYHNILLVEEIEDEEVDLKQLPFLREIDKAPEEDSVPPRKDS